MKKLERVVLVQANNDYSGSARVAAAILQGLRFHGCEVTVVTNSSEGAIDVSDVVFNKAYYRHSSSKVLTLGRFALWQLVLFFKIHWLARRMPGVTVYVNATLPIAAVLSARMARVDVIWHLHEIDPRPSFLKTVVSLVNRYLTIDKFIVPSRCAAECWRSEGIIADVLPNPPGPIECHASTYHSLRSSQPLTVALLCAPRAFKGVVEFKELARRLCSYQMSFVLALSESPDPMDRLLENLPDNLSVLLSANVVDVYKVSHVVMNLTRASECRESFGLTLLEGSFFGCVPMAPAAGGPCEIISDGWNGFLLDPEHIVDAAVMRLVQLLADAKLTSTMSTRARTGAWENFSNAKFRSRLRGVVVREVR